MNEEIKRGYVLKFSLIIICLSIVAMVFKFSSDDYEEQELIEIDSIDAYMEHWYEVIDTNSNGMPDSEEEGYYDYYDKL